jgi:hypothetical protein
MKRRYSVGMLFIAFCIIVLLHARVLQIRDYRKEVGQAFPTQLHLDQEQKELMEAAFGLLHPDAITMILTNAVQKYGNDKEKFFKFIMTKDLEGWTILHHYVVDGNSEHIRIILETARTVLDDPRMYEQFVNAEDTFTTTALLIGVERFKVDAVKQLVTITSQVLNDRPDLFFSFLMKTGSQTGHTALTFAVLQNQFQIVKILVCAAARVFGIGSSYFNKFLNTPDKTDKTAYTYAPQYIQNFLERYGAEGQDYIGELY